MRGFSAAPAFAGRVGGLHPCARLHRIRAFVLKDWRPKACKLSRVIPEIDIWRAANLMLKRYGDKALEESAARADELAAQDDANYLHPHPNN